jgi:hypothetical protein
MFEKTIASLSKDSEAVGVVDHKPGSMAPLDLDQRGKIGAITVHAVKAFNYNKNTLITMPVLRKQRVNCAKIIMRASPAISSRKRSAEDNAIMG